MNEAEKGEQGQLYHGKNIQTFYEISYSEILKAIEFFMPEADFSTDHGVKGEQYDNVFLVLGRGWNDYRFDEQLYLDPLTIDESKKKVYIRNTKTPASTIIALRAVMREQA